MKFEHIVGYHNLWTTLGDLITSLDLNTSMNMQSHHFALQDGEAVFTHSYYNMLEVMNERFGTKFIPEMSSFIGATHFTLAFAEDGDVSAPVESVSSVLMVEEVKQEVAELEENDTPLISLDVEPEVVEAPVVEEKVVDWQWIASLEDSKEDKAELKAYAKDEFGITLKGNLKLDNLVEKFKEELEAK